MADQDDNQKSKFKVKKDVNKEFCQVYAEVMNEEWS